MAASGKLLQCYMVMKIDEMISWKSAIIMYSATILGYAVPYVLVYATWVHLAEYCFPMPFIGQFCLLSTWVSNNVALWFLLSSTHQNSHRLSCKCIWIYISLSPIIFIIGVAYNQLSSLFLILPTKYEWCLGLMLPCKKKFNTLLTTKVAFKAAETQDLSAKIAMITCVGCIHSFSLAILMGSKISSTTAYVIMLLDSIPNILSCIKIIKLQRNRENSLQIEELKCLALKEFMEVSIPLVYCVSFVVAYYGPNAEIIGNVKNDYWQYKRVDDVFEKLSKILIFILFDSVRGMVFGLIMWWICRLNMLKIYCTIIYEYGLLLLVYISGALVVVFCYYQNYKVNFLKFYN